MIRHQLEREKLRGSDFNHTMSVAFLGCESFREFLPHDFQCCENCHGDGRKHLIYIRPLRDDGNPDWLLCVEGQVCCKAYDFIRQIPRSWWEQKSVELGVKREDQRGYVFVDGSGQTTEKSTKRVAVRQKAWRSSPATTEDGHYESDIDDILDELDEDD